MASQRPAWLSDMPSARGIPTRTVSDMLSNLTQNNSNEWQQPSSNWSGNGNSWTGSGRPAWASGNREGGLYTVVKYLNLIGNPVLYTFLLIGKSVHNTARYYSNLLSYL